MKNTSEADPSAIPIYVFEFSKADLSKLPPRDRRVLILGGHALNQLGLWMKLLRLSLNYQASNDVLDSLSAAQSQALVRILCGSLLETWRWIKSADVAYLVATDYIADIPDSAQAARKRLGKQFASKLLWDARNRYAFHFPDANNIDKAFSATPDNCELHWYLSEETTNSLYFGCEVVIGHGFYGLGSEKAEPLAGFHKLLGEAVSAANDISEFVGKLLYAIVNRHLGDRPRSQFAVTGSPGPAESIPFFFDRLFPELPS